MVSFNTSSQGNHSRCATAGRPRRPCRFCRRFWRLRAGWLVRIFSFSFSSRTRDKDFFSRGGQCGPPFGFELSKKVAGGLTDLVREAIFSAPQTPFEVAVDHPGTRICNGALIGRWPRPSTKARAIPICRATFLRLKKRQAGSIFFFSFFRSPLMKERRFTLDVPRGYAG